MTELPIIPLTGLDLRFEPAPWPFADERRAEIDAHFTKLRAAKPAMWNGRVLLLRRGEIAAGVLSGAYSEVDFASFVAWRDWEFPDKSVRNCFPMAALRSSDGAFLLGVMGAHTANAGHIYFAAGTPDPNDVVGDAVDLEGGVMRELTEEMGLAVSDVTPEIGLDRRARRPTHRADEDCSGEGECGCIGGAHPHISLRHKSSRNSRTCTSCER